MALSTKTIDFINRKMAATHIYLQNYAGILESEAKSNAPNYWKDRSSSAGARAGIHSGLEKHSNSFTIYLAHSKEYGIFLEEGTKPHEIRPRNGKALFWTGADHPVKKVKHPGTKERPLLKDTIDGNKDKLIKGVLKLWE